MEPWHWAIVLKPLGLLALFALVVIPVALALKRFWPEGRLKNILFDRTFRDRHPGVFTMAVILGYAFIGLVCFAVYRFT